VKETKNDRNQKKIRNNGSMYTGKKPVESVLGEESTAIRIRGDDDGVPFSEVSNFFNC